MSGGRKYYRVHEYSYNYQTDYAEMCAGRLTLSTPNNAVFAGVVIRPRIVQIDEERKIVIQDPVLLFLEEVLTPEEEERYITP